MTSKAQRQVLLGLQSSAGVGVVPDFALRALLDLKPKVDKVKVEEDIGSFAPARHYIGSIMPEGKLSTEAALYEELPYFLAMAMGMETPSGGGSPYTWTFALPDDTAEAFALFSVEYTDGNTWVVRAEDVFATELTLSGEAGQAWKVEATLAGGATTYPAALTGTPAPLTTVGTVKMAETQLFIDALYANIGTTEMGQLVSFTWKLSDLQHAKQFAGSLYPNGRGNDRWAVSLEVIAEVENALIQDARDLLLVTTRTAVQVKATSAPFSAAINGSYMLEDVDTLDDRDGNNIVKLTYSGEKDASNNTGGVILLSSLAAL